MVYGFLAKLNCLPLLPREVRIVPKFAATLASLLLIASSIGVNIARYPEVGRSVEPAVQTGAAETTNSTPPAQQSDLGERANPDSLPRREITALAPTENRPIGGALDSKAAAGTPRPQLGPAVAILDVQPRVPVAGLPTAGGGAIPPSGDGEVRRLPPIEPSTSTAGDLQDAWIDAAEPYPATATP